MESLLWISGWWEPKAALIFSLKLRSTFVLLCFSVDQNVNKYLIYEISSYRMFSLLAFRLCLGLGRWKCLCGFHQFCIRIFGSRESSERSFSHGKLSQTIRYNFFCWFLTWFNFYRCTPIWRVWSFQEHWQTVSICSVISCKPFNQIF